MDTDPAIWQGAMALVKEHGEDAVLHAAQHADGCLDRGDLSGRRTWHRILMAVEWLQAKEGAHPFKMGH